MRQHSTRSLPTPSIILAKVTTRPLVSQWPSLSVQGLGDSSLRVNLEEQLSCLQFSLHILFNRGNFTGALRGKVCSKNGDTRLWFRPKLIVSLVWGTSSNRMGVAFALKHRAHKAKSCRIECSFPNSMQTKFMDPFNVWRCLECVPSCHALPAGSNLIPTVSNQATISKFLMNPSSSYRGTDGAGKCCNQPLHNAFRKPSPNIF